MSVTVKNTFEKAPDEMRNVLCATLVELAKDNPNIVAMDADTLGSSGLKPSERPIRTATSTAASRKPI